MEIVHAIGSENESNEMNIGISISPYNYNTYILVGLESVTDSISLASIVSICKSKGYEWNENMRSHVLDIENKNIDGFLGTCEVYFT